MDLGLSGAVVIVAGGTSGIGRAAADCCAADGARVAVLARSRDALDVTAEELAALGSPDTIGVEADLRDAESVDAAFDKIGARWGRVNALVNAVGPTGVMGNFENYTDEDWHNAVDGVALSAVRTIRAALPYLRAAPWARIVNVSAISTKRQSPPLIAYTAAKAALTSLTKNLSKSLAVDGILVNAVSPGAVASDSFKAILARIPDVDENDLHDVMRYIVAQHGHPAFLDRAAAPAEIGPVIAFAASALNTYMTGANINVDGGTDFS